MSRANDLIQRIVEDPERSDLDEIATELLSEYDRGSDLSSLRSLLHSEDQNIVVYGTLIARELGAVGRPLLPEAERLLRHPSKQVRFLAIDCVQEWAGPSSGHEIATAVALVDDADEEVRWKAMQFLSQASREQLQAGVDHLAASDRESPYLSDLEWLLSPQGTDASQIAAPVWGVSASRRKFAAAAASRIAGTNRRPLEQAVSVGDHEVSTFAGDMLEERRDRFNELRPRFVLWMAISASILALSVLLAGLKQDGKLWLALESPWRGAVGVLGLLAFVGFAFNGVMALLPWLLWLLDRYGDKEATRGKG